MAYYSNEPRLPRHKRPRCGARTRKGTKCKAPAVWDKEHDRPRNGRCKLHGGLSTGPKTREGRQRIAKAASKRMKEVWAKRTPEECARIAEVARKGTKDYHRRKREPFGGQLGLDLGWPNLDDFELPELDLDQDWPDFGQT